MLVIFGWMRRFTILGVKLDECANCHNVCEHIVGRKTNWGHVFWMPVLFLGFSHGMACSTCTTWTPLSWQSVRAAMKSGVLPLDRPRPTGPALLAAAATEEGRPQLQPAAVFDRMLVNPKRGPWDLYLKAWPVLVAALLVAGALAPKTPAVAGSNGPNGSQPADGSAHQCWEAPDGSINGCRLVSGSIQGSASGTPLTCYFDEPLPAADTTLRCQSR
jgi:hypothetical protein